MANKTMIMETTLTWKITDFVVILAVFLFNAFVLDAELQSILLAVGGSFSGAMILAYYRRELSKTELLFKIFASSIGGLVLGTVLQTYFIIENPSYVLALFFTSSMLSLVVLRALLTFTEQNAVEGIRNILQKLIGFNVESGKRIATNEVAIEKQRKKIQKLEDDTVEGDK